MHAHIQTVHLKALFDSSNFINCCRLY